MRAFHFAGAALVLTSAISAPIRVLTSQTPCAITLDPVEQEAKPLLAKIVADPFHAAFGPEIAALAAADSATDAWLEDANADHAECVALTSDQEMFNRDAGAYSARCPTQVSDPDLYQSCRQEYTSLTERKAALDHRHATFDARNDALNSVGHANPAKVEAASGPARALLGPAHVEEAFRRFANYEKKSGNNSCEAMALMFAGLGARTDWNLDAIIDNAVKVLAGTDPPPFIGISQTPGMVGFDDSGFDPRYTDPKIATSHNQVRHFVGYLAWGAKHPNFVDFLHGLAVEVSIEYLNEWSRTHPGDYQLGVFGANLGKNLAQQPGLVRGLDGAIRRTLCR